jgi:hypothetical protein
VAARALLAEAMRLACSEGQAKERMAATGRLGYAARVNDVGPTLGAVLAIALLGCGRGASGRDGVHTAASASVTAASGSATVAQPGAPASAPSAPVTAVPPTSTFVGARSEKSCNAQTVALATHQDRGEVVLGGNATGIAATWRVRLEGRPGEQVAFAAFDAEGKRVAKTRGVGTTVQDVPPRVYASASEWTVIWFDAKGLAYARPKPDLLPVPDVLHLAAVSPEAAGDVGLAASPGGSVLACTPFGAEKAQLGVFLFADEKDLAKVSAVGVTHHAKQPHRPTVAASTGGVFLAWDDAGALLGSHFDASGKETAEPCTIAPAADKPERFALAAVGSGAVASWLEGTRVRARALDAAGCPTAPAFTVGEGRWPSVTSAGNSAVVAWVAPDGRVVGARLAANGAPPAKGIDAAEGSSGARDAPFVLGFGAGKLAFAWSETMSPTVKTKRLVLRIVDAACVP